MLIPLTLISFMNDNKLDPVNEVENMDAVLSAVVVKSIFAIESGTIQRSESRNKQLDFMQLHMMKTKLYRLNYMHLTWFICLNTELLGCTCVDVSMGLSVIIIIIIIIIIIEAWCQNCLCMRWDMFHPFHSLGKKGKTCGNLFHLASFGQCGRSVIA